MLLPIISALLGILAFLAFNWWFFGFFFLIPLFIFFLKEKRLWRLILGTFIFRLIMVSGTVYFTLEPMTWLTSIFIFLGLPVAIFIIKRGLIRFSSLSIVNGQWSLLVLLPFLWTFFDHLEARYSFLPTYIMTAGNIFGSSAFVGLATINGLIFLTFFGVTINALITFLILKIKPLNPVRNNISNGVNFKFLALYSLLIIVIVLGAWQISKFQLQKNTVVYNSLENSFKIASLSTNEKFNVQSFNEIKNELTKKEFDLLVLPEDILGSSFGINFYQNLAQKLNINLLATFDTIQNQKRYNSSVLFDKKGEMVDIYNKNHLTFAGEYWPFGKWIPFYFEWLKKIEPGIQNYAVFDPQHPYYRGEKKNLTIEYGSRETIKFASLICLEIHYPEDLKKYRERGARFVINPTSNRWLDLGIKHFLYLTNNLRKIEAIRLKMPIISSGVRDLAGVILPDGKSYLVNFESKNKDYGLFRGEIRW